MFLQNVNTLMLTSKSKLCLTDINEHVYGSLPIIGSSGCPHCIRVVFVFRCWDVIIQQSCRLWYWFSNHASWDTYLLPMCSMAEQTRLGY